MSQKRISKSKTPYKKNSTKKQSISRSSIISIWRNAVYPRIKQSNQKLGLNIPPKELAYWKLIIIDYANSYFNESKIYREIYELATELFKKKEGISSHAIGQFILEAQKKKWIVPDYREIAYA